jgi:hypothetical protein
MSKEADIRVLMCKAPEKLHERVKVMAARKKVTMSELVLEFITKGLGREQASTRLTNQAKKLRVSNMAGVKLQKQGKEI